MTSKMLSPACVVELVVVIAVIYGRGADGACPGNCVTSAESCLESKGKVGSGVALCFGHDKVCCIPPETNIQQCGSVASDLKKQYYFASPSFPDNVSGNLLCTFTMHLRNDNVGIALDFLFVESEGNKPGRSASCDSDQIFIRGFDGFMLDALCGNIAGYQLFIDHEATKSMKELTIVAIMTSKSYRWFIKVNQLTDTSCPIPDGGTSTAQPSPVTSTGGSHAKVRRSIANFVKPLASHHQQDYLIPGNQLDNSQPNPVPMIISGDTSEQGDFPWQASIRFSFNLSHTETFQGCDVDEGLHVCGGTIISETEILTAAHCFLSPLIPGQKFSPFAYKVVVGDLNKCRDRKKGKKFRNPAVQEFLVEKIIMHYNYNSHMSFNDIAIVKIQGKIRFNKDVHKVDYGEKSEISLRYATIAGSKFAGKTGVITGWGTTSNTNPTKTADILQYSNELLVMDSITCKKNVLGIALVGTEKDLQIKPKYKNITSSYVCISSKGTTSKASVSQGDSGGPFVVYTGKNATLPVLVGVISMREMNLLPGIANSHRDPVSYLMSVAYYRKWIDSAMCQ